MPSCPYPCLEGCECDEGYVLMGDKCEPASSCGCEHQGRFYRPGEQFWADERCQVRCRCDHALGMVVCEEAQCGATEMCQMVDGVRDCFPASESVCVVSGNLHHKTFDGVRYQLSRGCVYRL
eukprot:g20342.t1